MTKILVLGSSGLIGHMVFQHLNALAEFDAIGTHNATQPPWSSTRLNVSTEFQRLTSLIDDNRPEIVINCVGLLIDASSRNVADAISVNALFPHKLKSVVNSLGSQLIQVSTDCVFSGVKADARPYYESDICDGTTIYSKTKALGEIVDDYNLTIRTSVIGPELKLPSEELFNWLISNKQSSVDGYTNAFWSGVTSLELAKAIRQLISEKATGLIHVCSKSAISKYALLKLIAESLSLNIKINPVDSYKNDKTLFNSRNSFSYVPPNYPKMIKNMADFVLKNPHLYAHYNFQE